MRDSQRARGLRFHTRGRKASSRSQRNRWKACVRAGLGTMSCSRCARPVSGNRCGNCKSADLKYRGLIFHDLRRTAARNLRRAGVAEGVIQKIGGWRTRSVFERYAIVTQADITDAMLKLESREDGHSFRA